MYLAEMHTVLRPQSSVASITLWPFYCEDHLAHGSPYDIGKFRSYFVLPDFLDGLDFGNILDILDFPNHLEHFDAHFFKKEKIFILAEIAEMEQQQREDEHQESLVDVGASVSVSRRLLDANYRCTHFLLLDSFSSLVEVW